jgi:hypothetical protein
MAEKKPIIRVYFAKIKEAFYNLSEEEKYEFMSKDPVLKMRGTGFEPANSYENGP